MSIQIESNQCCDCPNCCAESSFLQAPHQTALRTDCHTVRSESESQPVRSRAPFHVHDLLAQPGLPDLDLHNILLGLLPKKSLMVGNHFFNALLGCHARNSVRVTEEVCAKSCGNQKSVGQAELGGPSRHEPSCQHRQQHTCTVPFCFIQMSGLVSQGCHHCPLD